MEKLINLKPQRVFYYFEKICSIPHGSGNTAEISEFCYNTAKNLGLSAKKDSMNNVIISKPATKGKEKSPTVIIQGHLDMVCEKDSNCEIDFLKDGLDIYVENGFVKARGTTLGADDGIAVAMCLALLEADDIAHPNLEIVLTVDEETGMYGAEALDGKDIKGRLLINIDSEDEGIFTVSCAGGINAKLNLKNDMLPNIKPCYKITVGGLMGGHSGVDIDKGRLNSNKIAAEFLNSLDSFNLVSINGGQKANAIPTLTEAIIATNEDVSIHVDKFIKVYDKQKDNGLFIKTEKVDTLPYSFTEECTKNTIAFLCFIPNGIINFSKNISGLVETSLNLGILKTEKDEIYCEFALRSSVNDEKLKLIDTLKKHTEKYGGKAEFDGNYPAWEYKEDSILREKMSSVYKKMYNEEPEIIAIHAGLECGLLSEKLIGLDAVSIGPNMKDIHTPRERLEIASVERVYRYLINLLSEI
ncbi:MAG: aminoacyl-histidine dipeptidase [Ruminococcaceae bacterium]|nr:aminoacyl-histidine dipeptidase [Oscillospiraceae bacterium]